MSKTRGRPFEPGNKGGPGRPRGSRNRDSSEADKILEEFEQHLIRKAIAMAGEGNTAALKICLEKIRRIRDGRVSIPLPKIKSAGDVASAGEKVTKRMGKGFLSPAEAAKIMNVLETQLRVIESCETERRVQKLEEDLGIIKKHYSE